MPILCLRRFLYAIVLVALGTSLTSRPAHAQQASDTQVKVALIYNFITFTEWPLERSQASTAITVCVRAKGELHDAIQALKAKAVRNQKILIKSFNEASDHDACDVMYIDSGMHAAWPSIKKKVAGKSILTVAEGEASSNSGIIISLGMVDNRMAFDIDTSAAREADLVLSSKLLRLARKIQ